jgi:hypothetical protein
MERLHVYAPSPVSSPPSGGEDTGEGDGSESLS